MTNGHGTKVRKRDGSLTPLDLDKIHKVVDEACEGLGSGVSASAVEMNSDLQFFDGIQTKDIHEILILLVILGRRLILPLFAHHVQQHACH